MASPLLCTRNPFVYLRVGGDSNFSGLAFLSNKELDCPTSKCSELEKDCVLCPYAAFSSGGPLPSDVRWNNLQQNLD